MSVICPYCSKPARLVPGPTVYPDRSDLADRQFWQCRPCHAHVGCHPGTDKPLGPLAKRQLRQLRMEAHTHFDNLWKEAMKREGLTKGQARRRYYGWLAHQLGGTPSNIGHMDELGCSRVIAICRQALGASNFPITPLPGDPGLNV
jgi:hypothetical protein